MPRPILTDTKKALQLAKKQLANGCNNLFDASPNVHSPERLARQLVFSVIHGLDHGSIYTGQLRANVDDFLNALLIRESEAKAARDGARDLAAKNA